MMLMKVSYYPFYITFYLLLFIYFTNIFKGSSQASISQQSFITDTRKRGYSQIYSEKELKKKIIYFMISNNLSIKSITSKSFKDLLEYLKG